VLDGQARTISTVLQWFPEGASGEFPDLALARAAAALNGGRLDDAGSQLAVAASHLESTPPSHRRRLEVAIASLRLAGARRSGQLDEVVEEVRLLDAWMARGTGGPVALDTELRAVALLNLGGVETWSGRFAEAERHVTEGATLAHAIGRRYLEVACRAYQAFPSPSVSIAAARERGRDAVDVAEQYGLGDSPALAPACGAVACTAVWMGELEGAERWLRRGWDVL